MYRIFEGRSAATRSRLHAALDHVGYEVIPFKKAAEAALTNVPTSVPLTVTASLAKGQDATVDLAVALVGQGYQVIPHLSAQLVRDRAHLHELVGRCRSAGISGVFVVGGDRAGAPTDFVDGLDLLRALHEIDHGFSEIGIGGHPEGHPDVSEEVLFQALKDKAALATYITTQIVFDTRAILRWVHDLRNRGIELPVYVGVPGAVHRQKLLRVSGSLGIGESAKFLRKQQGMFWRFFVPGGFRPQKIIQGVAPYLGMTSVGIAGFHVFTFNDLGPTETWRKDTLRQLASTGPSERRWK